MVVEPAQWRLGYVVKVQDDEFPPEIRVCKSGHDQTEHLHFLWLGTLKLQVLCRRAPSRQRRNFGLFATETTTITVPGQFCFSSPSQILSFAVFRRLTRLLASPKTVHARWL